MNNKERLRPIKLVAFLLLSCSLLTGQVGSFRVHAGENSTVEVDELNGLWTVGAIDYDLNNNPARNAIVDINDSDDLSDLYEGVTLVLKTDGTFEYVNSFIHEGTYQSHPSKPDCYILKTDRSYRLDYEDGEIVEVESDSKSAYILEWCDDTLHFQEYDSFTGSAKANDNGFYFVKSEEGSSYIQDNKEKMHFKDSGNAEEDSSQGVSDSSYAGILSIYTEKMEKAAPGLVKEYKSEASGISDITRLAEICNDKVSELAEICNEGMEKMADLMYKNGDSYTTYSNWAEKLMENYTGIAQDIQDAYIESAM